MKDINLKHMAKDMSFEDQARLLFADHVRQCDTNGEERVLTGEEEKAIVKDLQDKGRINDINRITRLFNMNLMASLDMQTAALEFDLVLSRVEMLVLGMMLHNRRNDLIEEVRHIVGSKKCGCAKEIDESLGKHETGISDFYAFMHDDGNRTKKGTKGKKDTEEGQEPNHSFQKVFVTLLSADKSLRKALYVLDVLSHKAGVDLMTKDSTEMVQQAEKRLVTLKEQDGFLRILRAYRMAMETGLIRKENFAEPRFLSYLLDPEQVLPLTSEDKEAVVTMIERRRQPHP